METKNTSELKDEDLYDDIADQLSYEIDLSTMLEDALKTVFEELQDPDNEHHVKAKRLQKLSNEKLIEILKRAIYETDESVWYETVRNCKDELN